MFRVPKDVLSTAPQQCDRLLGREAHPDVEAFWVHWETHQDFLYNFAMSWMKNPLEAREALSGAMMKALEGAAGKLQEIGNVRAWLVTVVRNHCIDQLRLGQRLPQSLEDLDWLGLRSHAANGQQEGSPEAQLVRQENYFQLRSEIENLPIRLREAVILRAYQDMPYKEIALQLRISPENARKRVQQARDVLRDRIHAQDTGPIRRPDLQEEAPRGERHAAEDILGTDRGKADISAEFAHPLRIPIPRSRTIELQYYLFVRPKRVEQRVESLARYVRKHPGGYIKRNQLAELLLLRGDLKAARQHYLQVLEKHPEQAQARISAARLFWLAGRRHDARRLLANGLPLCREHGTGLHLMALHAQFGSEPEAALPFWRSLLTESGSRPGVHRSLVRYLLHAQAYPQAAYLLADLVRRYPKNREFHALRLHCLRHLGDQEALRHCARGILGIFSDDPYAICDMLELEQSTVELDAGLAAQARAAIKMFRAQAPDTAITLALRLALKYRKGASEHCVRLLVRALEEQPRHLQVLEVVLRWAKRLGDRAIERKATQSLESAFPDREKIAARILLF